MVFALDATDLIIEYKTCIQNQKILYLLNLLVKLQ